MDGFISSRITRACIFGFLLRITFTVYGIWHDAVVRVKYTDIDYQVFTDAARYVHQGKSPYDRETFRYSPLLAWILVPNITLHPVFGKLLFSVFDIVTGFMMHSMLTYHRKSHGRSLALRYHPVSFIGVLWLWNPFIITISTRGNAEAIQSFIVLSTLFFLLNGRVCIAAVFFGLSVHFKLYPVVFSLPILFHLWNTYRDKENRASTSIGDVFRNVMSLLGTKDIWSFFGISFFVFLGLTGMMYSWYGMKFLHETYFYHFSRTDLKHNFSPYFYVLAYVKSSKFEKLIGFLAFVPQASCVTWLGWKYHDRLPLALFLEMFAFVSLNKVCTSQYFIWYLSLLPLALGFLDLELRLSMKMIFYWISSQGLWLGLAYLFEFQSWNVLFLVWLASLLFLAANVFILWTLVQCADRTQREARKQKE